MKKTVAMIMVLLLMMTMIAAFAESDSFSLQGGLSFGMSKQEVVDFEAGKEIEVKRDTGKLGFSAGELYGNGFFADNRFNIWFSFTDDGLSSILFEEDFGTKKKDYYNEIETTLTEKYGAPVPLEDKYIWLKTDGITAVGLYNDSAFSRYISDIGCRNLKAEDFNQHIVRIDNGYISIQHLLIGSVFSNEYGTINQYRTILSYSFISEERYEKAIYGDTEREKQAEEARNNDL